MIFNKQELAIISRTQVNPFKDKIKATYTKDLAA